MDTCAQLSVCEVSDKKGGAPGANLCLASGLNTHLRASENCSKEERARN